MTVVEGTAYWASVKVPNTNFEPMYTVNLVVEPDVAEDFKSQGFHIKDMEEGPAVIIKRKVNGPNGMIRRSPDLLDRQKQPIDVTVGNGSRVKVMWRHSQYAGGGGIINRAELVAVQVVELVEYSEAASADATDQAIASAEF